MLVGGLVDWAEWSDGHKSTSGRTCGLGALADVKKVVQTVARMASVLLANEDQLVQE